MESDGSWKAMLLWTAVALSGVICVTIFSLHHEWALFGLSFAIVLLAVVCQSYEADRIESRCE